MYMLVAGLGSIVPLSALISI